MTGNPKDQIVTDGKPYYATLPNDMETCCDCALTHRVKYEILDKKRKPIEGARLRITVWVDDKETDIRRTFPNGIVGEAGLWISAKKLKKKRKK